MALNALPAEERKKLGITTEDMEKLAYFAQTLQEDDDAKALRRITRDPVAKRILANAALKGDKKLWTEVVSGEVLKKAETENGPDALEEKLASVPEDEIYDEGRGRPSKRADKFSQRQGMKRRGASHRQRSYGRDDDSLGMDM